MAKHLPDPSRRSLITRLTKSLLEMVHELNQWAEERHGTSAPLAAPAVAPMPSPPGTDESTVTALQQLPVSHLIYLLTFDPPRPVDNHVPLPAYLGTSWATFLGEEPTVVTDQLQDLGALVRADVRVHLAYNFARTELQTMLSTRRLPTSGNKEELVGRLVQADEAAMWAAVAGLTLLECTPLAWYTAKKHLVEIQAAESAGRPDADTEAAQPSNDIQATQPSIMKEAIKWILAAAAGGVIGNRVDAEVMALVDSLRAQCVQADSATPVDAAPSSPLPTPQEDTPVPKPLSEPQPQPTCRPYSTPISKLTFDWVTIPAGEFLMGSDKRKDPTATDRELPQYRLYLPTYRIARVPVTNAQYQQFVDAIDHRPPGDWKDGQLPSRMDNHPVVCVTWYDAVAFCEWAGVRLPSEAEWEKAARGIDGRIYPWGNVLPDKELCNYDRNVGNTTPVGRYPRGASPYGVLDMAGNVWEWTSSLYKLYPYNPKDGREDPAVGGIRVLRGGSFEDGHSSVRCADRNGYVPDLYDFDLFGFRVMSPGP